VPTRRMISGPITVIVLAAAVGGCVDGPPATATASPGSPATSPGSPISPPTAAAVASATGTPGARAELPAGFPIPDGAVRTAAEGDEDLAARWTAEITGAAAYAYFVAALPAAGYGIEELIPGGTAAIIRLLGSGGEPWILILTGMDPLLIELRRDRDSAIGGDRDP